MPALQALSSGRLLACCLIKALVPTLCPLHASPQAGPSPLWPRAEPPYPETQSGHRVLAFQIRKTRQTVREFFSHGLNANPDAPLSQVQRGMCASRSVQEPPCPPFSNRSPFGNPAPFLGGGSPDARGAQLRGWGGARGSKGWGFGNFSPRPAPGVWEHRGIPGPGASEDLG